MNNELIIEAPDGLPHLDYSREFDAPVSALFRAYTVQDIFEQWFGPEGLPLAVHRFDPQTGGGFRYVVQGRDQEWGFHGVYHEVRADELIDPDLPVRAGSGRWSLHRVPPLRGASERSQPYLGPQHQSVGRITGRTGRHAGGHQERLRRIGEGARAGSRHRGLISVRLRPCQIAAAQPAASTVLSPNARPAFARM